MIINGKEVQKALIIKSYYGNLILDGQKHLELRGSNTNIRGTVALIFSGTNKIWGTVDLINSKPMSTLEFERLKRYHRFDGSRKDIGYKNLWGWILNNAERVEEPISFKPKKGCVIWVNLE